MLRGIIIAAFLLQACSGSSFTGSDASAPTKKKEKATGGTKDEPVGDDGDDEQDPGNLDADGQGEDDGGDVDDKSKDKGDLGEEDEELPPEVEVPLNYQAFQGEAADTNCASVQVNGGPIVDLGCNHGPNQFIAKTLKAREKPFCNVIRLVSKNVTINATITTENPQQVRWGAQQSIVNFLGMRLFEPTAGTVEAHINDNGDDKDDIDVRFQVSGLASVAYTIENSGAGCKP